MTPAPQETGAPPPPSPDLSPEQARRILSANVANIVKKARAGRTLSGKEVDLVRLVADKDAPPIGFARNQVELGEALGVSRRTILRWLQFEGCPGARSDSRYCIDEWRTWARAAGLKVADEGPDAGELKAEQLGLQNEKLRHEIGILQKLYIPAKDVEMLGARLGAAVRKVVVGLHLLAPSVAGMTVAEAERLLRDKEDEIIAQLHTVDVGLEDLQKPSVADASYETGLGTSTD